MLLFPEEPMLSNKTLLTTELNLDTRTNHESHT